MTNSIINLNSIPPDEADKLNHFLYCHHCQHMSTHKLQGVDDWGSVVFECPGCHSVVCLTPIGYAA